MLHLCEALLLNVAMSCMLRALCSTICPGWIDHRVLLDFYSISIPPASAQVSPDAARLSSTSEQLAVCRQDAAQLELQVRRHQEEQERSFEEQSILALEDRKSSLLRAMTSSDTGERCC